MNGKTHSGIPFFRLIHGAVLLLALLESLLFRWVHVSAANNTRYLVLDIGYGLLLGGAYFLLQLKKEGKWGYNVSFLLVLPFLIDTGILLIYRYREFEVFIGADGIINSDFYDAYFSQRIYAVWNALLIGFAVPAGFYRNKEKGTLFEKARLKKYVEKNLFCLALLTLLTLLPPFTVIPVENLLWKGLNVASYSFFLYLIPVYGVNLFIGLMIGTLFLHSNRNESLPPYFRLNVLLFFGASVLPFLSFGLIQIIRPHIDVLPPVNETLVSLSVFLNDYLLRAHFLQLYQIGFGILLAPVLWSELKKARQRMHNRKPV